MGTLQIKGKLYDSLKWMTMVLFPGFGTLYNALSGTWNLPATDKVTATDIAVCTFLGLVLGLSNLNYKNDDSRFDGVAYVDRLDPTNNPDILLKDPNSKPPSELHLKVQETAPPAGNRNQDDEPDDPIPELRPGLKP